MRFPEYSGEWEIKKLDELFKISAGGDIPSENVKPEKDEIFKYPIYANAEKNKGFYGYSDIYRVEENVITVAGRGVNIGIAHARNHKFYPIVRLLVLRPIKSENIYFFEYQINRLNLFKESTGVPQLTAPQVSGYEVFYPQLPEQTKIATFLTAVDERLNQLKQKKTLLEQYKKGVMQKIFMQDIRFNSNNENDYPEWEVKSLGSLAERMTCKNKECNTNVLTISAQQGLVSQLEFFNKSVSAKDVSGYYLLKKDDFAYNKSYSNGYPMGAIKRLKYYEKGVVSTLYICFTFNDSVNLSFMEQYFESGIHNQEIEKVAQEGARNHGLLNIGLSDFFSTEIVLPCLAEQTQIANFLLAIDEKINCCTEQISKTDQYKKGLLQQMFV